MEGVLKSALEEMRPILQKYRRRKAAELGSFAYDLVCTISVGGGHGKKARYVGALVIKKNEPIPGWPKKDDKDKEKKISVKTTSKKTKKRLKSKSVEEEPDINVERNKTADDTESRGSAEEATTPEPSETDSTTS